MRKEMEPQSAGNQETTAAPVEARLQALSDYKKLLERSLWQLESTDSQDLPHIAKELLALFSQLEDVTAQMPVLAERYPALKSLLQECSETEDIPNQEDVLEEVRSQLAALSTSP